MGTTGERIAAGFSGDKCHLTDAEQRRLAEMIDGEVSMLRREVSRESALRHHILRVVAEQETYCRENRALDDAARTAPESNP
jgi:hypothetical protein